MIRTAAALAACTALLLVSDPPPQARTERSVEDRDDYPGESDWSIRVRKDCRKYPVIVVGRVTKVGPVACPPGGGAVTPGTIAVQSCLKGQIEDETIEAEFRFASGLEITPDTEDAIWFLGRTPDGKGHLVTEWRHGLDSLRQIRATVYYIDRSTRTPGMPAAPAGPGPLGLALGVDVGNGRAAASGKVDTLDDRLLVQFENRSESDLGVLPYLWRVQGYWRYPIYGLEVVGADGRVLPQPWTVECASITPLDRSFITTVRPGEVFRTWADAGWWRLPPGKYRVRLKYTAERDPASKPRGLRPGLPPAELDRAMAGAWRGVAVSNWVDVEIAPKTPAANK